MGLKRNKPLKRTPLNRGDAQLRRSGPPKQRSAKTDALYDQRRPLVARLLSERPWCEACAVFAAHDGLAVCVRRPSQDVHEVVRRSQGGSILDESNLLCVCRFPCHRRITENPDLAEHLGLALPSWATPAMVEEAARLRLEYLGGNRPTPSWRTDPGG